MDVNSYCRGISPRGDWPPGTYSLASAGRSTSFQASDDGSPSVDGEEDIPHDEVPLDESLEEEMYGDVVDYQTQTY